MEPTTCAECGIRDEEFSLHAADCPSGFPTRDHDEYVRASDANLADWYNDGDNLAGAMLDARARYDEFTARRAARIGGRGR